MVLLKFRYKKKNFEIDAKKVSWFNPRGLMFRRRANAPALLFEFEKPGRFAIHSLFVFLPFVAIWLDNKNKVIEIKKIKSWKFHVTPKKKFCKLIEIPLNKKFKKFDSLVGN